MKAFSLLTVKAVDDERRIVTGIASTPTVDRQDDVVVPEGAIIRSGINLHLYHSHNLPVGNVKFGKPTKAGIPFEATIPTVAEEGTVRERVNEAWHSVKYRLLGAVSIGFRVLEDGVERMKNGGLKYTKWEMLELSLVSVPANPDAVITGFKSMDPKQIRDALGVAASDDSEREQIIKSIDQQQRAASGNASVAQAVRLNKAPVAGSKRPTEGKSMNVQEQIKAFETQRADKAAKMDAIMAKSAEQGETLDAEQEGEYDSLKSEVGTIDKHIARLRDHEKAVASKAVPVVASGNGAEEVARAGAAARSGQTIVVERKLPPGVGFARLAGAIAAAKGSFSDAERIVKSRFPDDHKLHNIVGHMDRIKAAVDIGTTTDTDYASPLVQYRDLADEFIEFLRPQTILGRIPNLRRVPFNISVPRQTSGGSASWVGEGAPKPVTQFAFDNVTLGHTKLASIAVITQELARFSSPSAEIVIRDSLAGALIQQMDSDFINPANAGVTNVKPASITNGVSAIPSSGSTESDVREDIQSLFAPFIAANLSPQNGVWIMSATNALALSLMVNALGQTAFPGITMNGGTFWGMPVIVSEAVGNIVVLANARDIMLADDGQVTIDSSSEASVQMDSAPTNPVVAATVLISLWQQNLLGIRAERFVNWTKARTASVQYLSGVAWGAQT